LWHEEEEDDFPQKQNQIPQIKRAMSKNTKNPIRTVPNIPYPPLEVLTVADKPASAEDDMSFF
jgi:hypothetical protein